MWTAPILYGIFYINSWWCLPLRLWSSPKGVRHLADSIAPTPSPSSYGTYYHYNVEFDEEYLLQQIAYVCAETEYAWRSCDCSAFDFDQGLGAISCEVNNQYCADDSQDSLCYNSTYDLEIFSPEDIVSKRCDIFSKGEDLTSLCYSFEYTSVKDYFYGQRSMEAIEFDGAECAVTTKTEEKTEPSCSYNDEGLPFIEDYTWSYTCREIDCTNTNLGRAISECDGEYLYSVVRDSLL